MYRILTVLLILVSGPCLAASDPQFPAYAIPKELVKNAHAVLRMDETTVDIRSESKYVVKRKWAVTVLDEEGEQFGYWYDFYSKLRSIDHIEGDLYDAFGNKLKSLKKSDIYDSPVYDGVTFASDARNKIYAFSYKNYPYTVVYQSEVSSNLTMFVPQWKPVIAAGLAVQQSKFQVNYDKEMSIRWKMFNTKLEPISATDGKRNNLLWTLNNFSAISSEYAAPSVSELGPYALITMGSFKMEDFQGSLTTWSEYGAFIGRMREGLDDLSPDMKAKVREMTKTGTKLEKVTALFQYLQQHSHYIAVQIGIGSWRPFPASYVASKGYGDCKALSNFMVAMLKEAGITGYYALVNAGNGEKDISTDFPSPWFNHAICAVPMEKDTLWLECTNQNVAAGYSGSHTGNRHALLITEKGGVVVATPRYTQKENVQRTTVKGKLLGDGSLQMQASNCYRGVVGESAQRVADMLSKDEQLKHIKSNLDIPSYEITDFSIVAHKDLLSTVDENYQFTANQYGQITGKRIFILPNIMNRWDVRLSMDSARVHPIHLTHAFTEIDTVQIIVPEGYTVESAVKAQQLQTVFGKYEVTAKMEGNNLIYYRKLERFNGQFPASDYPALVAFYEQIYKSDRTKMVLVKTE